MQGSQSRSAVLARSIHLNSSAIFNLYISVSSGELSKTAVLIQASVDGC